MTLHHQGLADRTGGDNQQFGIGRLLSDRQDLLVIAKGFFHITALIVGSADPELNACQAQSIFG